MSTQSQSVRIVPAVEVTEGAGVTIHRTIGTPVLRNYDPFMLLDHFNSDDPEDYVAGFPPHPHRGFNTFTYMIEGDMEHKDSMGNTGNLGSGGAQWMKAASGVIHSEMPKQENGLMRGFQLWINLPAANKMDTPEYQEYKADAFPVMETDEASVKVLIGSYENAYSPIVDNITDVSYLDIQLKGAKLFKLAIPAENNSFIYVFEGSGQLGEHNIATHSLVTLTGNNEQPFTAGEEGARFILVSGKPVNEPVVQSGPFVMNTKEEIDQAMQDYKTNNFIRDKAWINRKR